MIKSNSSEGIPLNKSVLINLSRFCTLFKFAFFDVISIGIASISVATIFNKRFSKSKVIEIAPLPQPISIPDTCLLSGMTSSVFSIKISVSGLGIKTPGETKKSLP